jgi:hypothetical protein
MIITEHVRSIPSEGGCLSVTPQRFADPKQSVAVGQSSQVMLVPEVRNDGR